jgi:hypothetical protein
MNPLTGLTDYLRRVERRLRLMAFTKGAAITAVAALVFTVLAVLLANAFAFSAPSVTTARVLLFVALALALGIGLVVPLLRLNRRNAARETERKFPEFEERLLTFTERARTNPDDPFLPLLAADTLEVSRKAEPARVAGSNRILSFVAGAAGSLAVLIWLGTSGPGFLGYGTSLLWGRLPKGELTPYYDISVVPGNRTVRRLADQLIGAQLKGFQAQRIRMFAKYASSSKWEQADMRPQVDGTGYEFLIAGVPESLDYYVEAGGVHSKQYRLKVVDLPGIKKLKVTYHFPSWTGMKDQVEDPGGDLRAVEGTDADVAVETDRPLVNGVLLFDDGTKLLLRSGENGLRIASVPIRKDGMYHIAAVDQGEDVRLSPDYFIEAQKDEPPTVRITRPGRDARVNPIEEVTVAVEGQDDFGLNELSLHYSVNGDAEKTVSLLKSKGMKTASGSTTIALEDFKLSPGDLVSLYATSRDAHSIARTDMFFIQAEPFERRYSQSQESGGMSGAGGQDDNKISEREKEIIAATWNQIKDTSGDKNAAAENAGFLSGVQSKLRDQAHSLSDRMKARQLAGSSEEFKAFTADMDEAVKAMAPAADKLRVSDWQSALAPEQKALQHLLRAEAVMRDIKVAFGNRGGGGGSSGSGAERDLQSLFDLELDTEKNQYESGQRSASKDQRQKEIDEALQKLEQLARRQQELAEQQRRNQQVSQQRWQQEMLRREAEELQRKMEQLSRNQQSGQQQSGQQQSGQQQSGQQSGQSGRQSNQGGQMSSQQLQRAIEQLRQAQQDMRQSTSSQSEADSRRAAERLKEARDLLAGLREQQSAANLDDLARQAEAMANREQESNAKMRSAFGTPGQQQGQGATREQAEELAREKDQLANDYQKLEADMGKAARDSDSQATGRALSKKLRETLAQVQQNEINNRLRLSADFLRHGNGAVATMRDAVTNQALNNLRDQLREIRKTVGNGQQGADDKDRQALQQALAQTERLRKEMERGMQSRLPSGDRPNGDLPSRDRQGAGQQPGQSQDAQAGEGQPGQTGPRANGRQYGLLPSLGPAFGDAGDFLQNYRHTLRELENNPQIGKDLRDSIQNLYRLDPRLSPGNPELMNRIESQMLTGVEQIELQLRRQLDDQGGAVRSGSTEPVPQGYADAVAEYFRRLSKEK